MAYDKVVDSAVLDANLKSVADAIRTKGGTSANLAFPTDFVNAISAIETGGKVTMEKHEITIASDLGQPAGVNSIVTILNNNAFVKANYTKNGFAVLLYPLTPLASSSGYLIHNIYHCNVNIGSSNVPRYGFAYTSTSTTSLGFQGMTNKISVNGYNASFRTSSEGDLILYVANNRIVKAGTYILVVMCWEDL